MMSYWEKEVLSFYDTIIIGAGISGLFTALFLKRKFPDEKILVIDKAFYPVASTKNAGFACMGSLTELEDDLQSSTADEISTLFSMRYHGLQIMRQELGDENIHYRENGSYELLNEENESVIDKLQFWNERLFSVAERTAFTIDDNQVNLFSGFTKGIKNELEGEINTGKMWQTLYRKVLQNGIDVFRNTALKAFFKNKNAFQIELESGIQLNAKRLIFCTNAFAKQLLPEVNIEPARAQVIVTKPIDQLRFKGIYHFDRGYYYFREIDGRILFGGGRQLDKERENTHTLGSNEKIFEDLKRKLQDFILPNETFEIDYSWSGIMGFSETKKPICEQVDNRLYVLAGFGGMGVALAPYMARELINQIK